MPRKKMKQEYFIGMDVGGTKSDTVLFANDGTVLKRAVLPGANPLDVGFDEACARYLRALDAVREGFDGQLRCIYAGVACASFFGDRIRSWLAERVPAEKIRIEPDGACLVSTMLGHSDGACLICGTGSSLCYRFGTTYGHIGGWGYLIDSCASGFIIGKKVILAVVRDMDGRDGHTLLTPMLEEACGEPLRAHYEKIYRGGRPYIASFAHLMFEARRLGDRKAAEIFDECIADLSELIWTGYRRFGEGLKIVLNGGIFQNFPEYVAALKAHAPQQVELIDSDAPPVYGCAVEAMYDAGYTCDAAFKARFMEGYLREKAKMQK